MLRLCAQLGARFDAKAFAIFREKRDPLNAEILSTQGLQVPVPRSSLPVDSHLPVETDAESDARCAAAANDASHSLATHALGALFRPIVTACERLVALVSQPPMVERVKIEDGVVCVSRYVSERLVDRRRIRASGLSVDRHVDSAGLCARIDLVGADRVVQLAGHSSPSERDRVVEGLIAALRDEGAAVEVRTIVGRARGGADVSRRRRSVTLRRLSIVALAAASLQAALMLRWSQQASDASPAPLREPSFHLTSSSGAPVDETTMRGRPYAAFFGFTQCPQVCPATLLELTRAVEALGPDASKTAILFVSLDPERDTPEALSGFVAPFDGRVVALTGSAQELARAAQSFRVYFRKSALDGGGYTIDHTTLVYLVDAHGRLRDSISFMDRGDMAIRKLRAFVREEAAAS
jgi:cytochrome oxidase Cu insertion factor (SCO1/SenC/PrrC family)